MATNSDGHNNDGHRQFIIEKNGIHPIQRNEVPEIRDFFTNNNYWVC